MCENIVLEASVEPGLAEAVDRWAEENQVERSEVIHRALRCFLEDEEDRRRRIEQARQAIDELAGTGIFEPPEDDSWKASGGWR